MKVQQGRLGVLINFALAICCIATLSIPHAMASSECSNDHSERLDALIADFEQHASQMLPEGVWGMPSDMEEMAGKGRSITLQGNSKISFPDDLKRGAVTFRKGPRTASFRLRTDHNYSTRYKNNRLYFVNQQGGEVFCYYYNPAEKKVRELILVTEASMSQQDMVYTWQFDGAILEPGPQGCVEVYARNERAEASRSLFQGLDEHMQARIRKTLEKEMGKEVTFSEKGRLLYTIPAPFYVDGNKQVYRKDISYSIDNPSTLSLRIASLDSMTLPLLLDPSIDPLFQITDVGFVGEGTEDLFGFSVSSAGDFNGDGKDDVIVGAPGYSGGCAYVFYGGATGTLHDPLIDASAADVKLVHDDIGDPEFGRSVSSAGDFNGDGNDDVIVGAPNRMEELETPGAAFIFYGSDAPTGTFIDAESANIKLVGESNGDCFGWSVSWAGDFNGDGKDDVIVGAPHDLGVGPHSGSAFIFYGGATGSPIDASAADVWLKGEFAYDELGTSVSGAGDFNGDGKDDVIVGAPADHEDGSIMIGAAFIFYGGTAGPSPVSASDADIVLIGGAAWDSFGRVVSSAGDFNGDGKDDTIVGAENDDNFGEVDAGSAFIFYGGTADSTMYTDEADIKLMGEQGREEDTFPDLFGYSLSGVGDLNGDGKDDVIVGASGSRTYVFLGGSTGPTIGASSADLYVRTFDPWEGFGWSLSGAGDFNGDGKDELTVGAPFWDATGEEDCGSAFVLFFPFMGSTASPMDIKLVGEEDYDYFGFSVSKAGDFNGDGKEDVIVGAYGDDDHGTKTGAAYIFYGGEADPAIDASGADIKLVGQDGRNYFGHSVSDAGDFNGDGKDDVIVGAPGDDDGGSDSGCAFLFHGGATGPTMDASWADIKLVGQDGGDLFGWSVSGAGDFNGDGKEDVIVGAKYDDDRGTNSGAAFIFFGFHGPVMGGAIDASDADIKLVGQDAHDYFGFSVSGAGDFNGDGKDDVIVGAPYYDAQETVWAQSGGAFIYYGTSFFDGGPAPTINPSYAEVQLVGGDVVNDHGDLFGYSVSGAGDFNGDGKDDVIVGARHDDQGGTNSGAAYIFYGGGHIFFTYANEADIKLVGDDAYDGFGCSVSGAGDFNRDGKDDVIIGASADDDGGSNSGSAFFFLGGAEGPTIDASEADIKRVGSHADDFFGFSVSGAGDFNGDGRDDVIIGAQKDDDGGTDAGSAFLFAQSGLFVDYGALGLWYYDDFSFTLLDNSAWNPRWLCAYDGGLVVDYGIGTVDWEFGLWKYDRGLWTQIKRGDIGPAVDITGNAMVAFNGGVAVDYGASGLHFYDGSTWSYPTMQDPEWMCVYGDKLVVDFGIGYGLYEYNGTSWTRLGTADPDNTGNTMVAYGTGIVVDYGSAYGLKYYDGSAWSRLGTADPEWLCAYGDKLVVDYGSAYGLKQYDGTSWTQLGRADPDNTGNTMVAYGTGIAVDYGSAYGLKYYDGSAWSRLGTADPEWLCAYGDKLVVDYGSAYGLKQYDGTSWTQLGTADPDNTGNTMVDRSP